MDFLQHKFEYIVAGFVVKTIAKYIWSNSCIKVFIKEHTLRGGRVGIFDIHTFNTVLLSVTIF